MKKGIALLLCAFVGISLMACSGKKPKDETYVDVELFGNAVWHEELPNAVFPKAARDIVVYESPTTSNTEALTVQSLMAIVNAEQPRITIAERGKVDWYTVLKEQYGDDVNYTFTSDETEIYEQFSDYINKVVIYDPRVPHTVNLASTLAGLEQALVTDFIGYARLVSMGYDVEIVEDYRGKFTATDPVEQELEVYGYMYDNYWERCNKRIIMMLDPTNAIFLRDYGMATKSAFLFLDLVDQEGETRALAYKFLGDMRYGNGAVMGWFPNGDEGSGISAASENGLFAWPADYSLSLTYFGAEIDEPVAKLDHTVEEKSIEDFLDEDGNVIPKAYVALAMSDGDNLQYMQGHMFNIWRYGIHADENNFPPVSWTVSPAASAVIPVIHNYFVNGINETYKRDTLLTGPSGIGYFYPNLMQDNENKDAMVNFARLTDSLCKQAGIKVVSTWHRGVTDNPNRITDDYLQAVSAVMPNIDGMYFQSSTLSDPSRVKTVNDVLFRGWQDGYNGNEPNIKEMFKGHILGAGENVKAYIGTAFEAPSYVALQGVPWLGSIMDVYRDIYRDVNDSEVSEYVEFVTIDQLVMLERISNGLTATRT